MDLGTVEGFTPRVIDPRVVTERGVYICIYIRVQKSINGKTVVFFSGDCGFFMGRDQPNVKSL